MIAVAALVVATFSVLLNIVLWRKLGATSSTAEVSPTGDGVKELVREPGWSERLPPPESLAQRSYQNSADNLQRPPGFPARGTGTSGRGYDSGSWNRP